LGGVGSVGALEGFAGLGHADAKRVRGLLSDVILDHTCRPVRGGGVVHGSAQSKHGLLSESCGVEDVQAADHGWLVHERQVVDGPRNTTQLGAHLDQHLRDDGTQILAFGNGVGEHHLGWDWVLGQEESLEIVVELALTFLAWDDEHHHLNSVIQLLLEQLDPAVRAQGTADSVDSWVTALVADLIKTLFQGTLELVGCLGISVSVEDSPSVQRRLSKHLCLNLTVQVTSTCLDVERVWSSAGSSTHHELSGFVLPARDLCWCVFELQVPCLLLLLALFVFGESGEEVLAFGDFPVSVGVDDSSQVLHEAEVSSHGICQTSELTQLGDECHLITSLSVLVDEKRLVWILDVFIVPSLVVLRVAHLSTLLVESRCWTHAEVNTFHAIRLLVVSII